MGRGALLIFFKSWVRIPRGAWLFFSSLAFNIWLNFSVVRPKQVPRGGATRLIFRKKLMLDYSACLCRKAIYSDEDVCVIDALFLFFAAKYNSLNNIGTRCWLVVCNCPASTQKSSLWRIMRYGRDQKFDNMEVTLLKEKLGPFSYCSLHYRC